MTARMPWTPEKDDELRALIAAGKGYAEISQLVGRSIAALRNRGSYLGLRLAPDVISRLNAEASRTRFSTPEYREAHRAGCRRRMRDDAFIETLRASMNTARKKMLENPEINARRMASIARRARERAAAKMAWCPADRLSEYRRLVKMKGVTAADARSMIEHDIARDLAAKERAERAAAAAMSPFQRMLERAQRGEIKLLDLDVVQPWQAPLRERDGQMA